MILGGLLTLTAAGCFIIFADSVGGLLAASVLLGTGHSARSSAISRWWRTGR
jgi:hypothetical protein